MTKYGGEREIRYLSLAESQRVRRTKASTENVLGFVFMMAKLCFTYLANNKKLRREGDSNSRSTY